MILDILSTLPPRAIAEYLSKVYLDYGNNNHFLVEGRWLQSKLARCYDQRAMLTARDAAWLCSIFAILAVGARFAHMAAKSSTNMARAGHQDDSDGGIGVVLYKAACRLIPDVLTMASVDSAQAFLLLADYTLPIDTQGLAFTYLGLCMKMCVQNGMHRKLFNREFDEYTVEYRKRIWWSAYILDM